MGAARLVLTPPVKPGEAPMNIRIIIKGLFICKFSPFVIAGHKFLSKSGLPCYIENCLEVHYGA